MELTKVLRLVLSTYALFPLSILFWLVVILVGSQYRRVARNETQLLGRPRHNLRHMMLYSSAFGLAGGLFASTLLVFFGISLFEIGVMFVWPVAILLLLVHPRYLCFAYAGGLVAVFSLVLNFLANFWPALTTGFLSNVAGIHIPGLLALIGILHLTESFLIAVSGHLFPSPLFVKTDKGVVGGFSLQKFWPLPLVGLVALTMPEAAAVAEGAAQMPDWWPIFASRTIPAVGQTLMYVLTPIVAGLGYGDLAISTTPQEKSKRSAINLGLYSLGLIGAAFLAFRWPAITIFAALFAPLGHEFLIMAGNKQEFGNQPIFTAPAFGVKVMDLFTGSAAAAAGIRQFDVIVGVNGYPVHDTMTFNQLLRLAVAGCELDVERDGKLLHLHLNHKGDPGIILTPDRFTPAFVEVKHTHFFSALREKLIKVHRLKAKMLIK